MVDKNHSSRIAKLRFFGAGMTILWMHSMMRYFPGGERRYAAAVTRYDRGSREGYL